MKFKAVLFDKDGVVVDSMQYHFEAYKIFLKSQGVNFNKDDWKRLMGYSSKETMEILKKKHGLNYNVQSAVIKKGEIADKLLGGGAPLFSGVKEIIKDLKKTHKIGLVTSATRSGTKQDLQNSGIMDLFEVIITSEDVDRSKPDSECYLMAAKKFKIGPSHCLAVEDTSIGIESAKRAGMKVVAITNTFNADKLSNADYLINDISSLKDILKD